MDGYDFHTVSLSISRLAEYYGKHRESISTSITLTLLFRPLGAAIFGLTGDLYGRKWPMIINLLLIAALQLATAWCDTFEAFLGVCLFFFLRSILVFYNANLDIYCRLGRYLVLAWVEFGGTLRRWV